MKVIAIKDAPFIAMEEMPPWAIHLNINRAYNLGDIFEIRKISHSELIIFHNLIGSTMEVTRENFKLLEELRDEKINDILENVP